MGLLGVVGLLLHTTAAAAAPIPLTVACAANASAPERYAAEELARYLRSIIATTTPGGATVALVNATRATAAKPHLAVGYGASRLLGASATSFVGLGQEGYVLLPFGDSLALSGGNGAPRGTLYSVNEFLESLGVHFVAPKNHAAGVTLLPKELPPSLPALRPRYVPKLEYRQTFGFELIGAPDFNVHLRLNKGRFNNPVPELDKAHGGVYPIYAKQGQGAGGKASISHTQTSSHFCTFWAR